MFFCGSRHTFLATAALAFFLQFGLAVSPALAAPDAERAMVFVRDGLAELIGILQEENLSKSEKTARLKKMLDRDFDVPAIGRFALGAYRRNISAETMAAYQQAFDDHVVETYIARLVRYVGPTMARLASEIIEVRGTRLAGKSDIFVQTGLARMGEKAIAVDWRVRENGGRLKIIDAYFLGVSLALTYKQEFAAVIRKNDSGVDGLITALRNRTVARRITP